MEKVSEEIRMTEFEKMVEKEIEKMYKKILKRAHKQEGVEVQLSYAFKEKEAKNPPSFLVMVELWTRDMLLNQMNEMALQNKDLSNGEST